MGDITNFVVEIKTLLNQARDRVYRNTNSIMTQTYFDIGKRIVEEEQRGKSRAGYGKNLLENLSIELTKEFGRGFSVANIKNMRQFYLTFENRQTVSSEFKLSYSHYIFLSRMKNSSERDFYEIEAIELTLPKESQIFASKYQIILPKKEDFRNLLMDSDDE